MKKDIESNQEDIERKKKLILICASVAIALILLISGIVFAKRSKKIS